MSGKGELLTGVHLDKSQVLGEGAFGVVYRGRLGDAGVAIKTIKANSPEQAAELEATLLEEAAVWAAVQHPNVVQFYGVHKDAEGGLYLVSELMDGSVEGLLHEDGERVADGEEALLTERQQLTMCLHVACALRRLHQLKILHSDLAARNVLYKRTGGGGDMVFKVTDFGLATVGRGGDGASASASRSYQLVSREQVPVRWCAPEVLKRQLYSAEADVWSLGVYMWEVFSLGELPYGLHMTNADIAQQITPAKSTFRLEQPEECPEDVYQIMHSCWKFGRKLRATLPVLEDQLRALRDQHTAGGGGASGGSPSVASPTPAARRPAPVAGEPRRQSPAPGGVRRPAPGAGGARRPSVGLPGERRPSPGPANRRATASPGRLAIPGGARQASPGQMQRPPLSPGRTRIRSQTSSPDVGDMTAAAEFFEKGVEAKKQGNSSVALEFYRQGAELGHAGAQSALGRYYLDGKVIQKNESLALDLFRKAAVQGDPTGMVAMGDAYKDGIGDVVKSLETAFEWYKKATEAGVPEAFYKLSQFHCRGLGVKLDYQQAYEVALRGTKIEGGGDCFDMLGYLTFNGLGVRKEPTKAMNLYKEGAAAGSLMAESSLALYMLHGRFGIAKNPAKALEILRRAAAAGIPSGLKTLAMQYVHGADGLPKDVGTGIDMMEKAAAAEDLSAMSTLGLWYVTGSHVQTNVVKGMALLESAAAQGFSEACLNLGNVAEAREDLKLAVEWWSKGLNYSATCCYKAAKELVRSAPEGPQLSRGISLLEKAVQMGSGSGAYSLGSMYCTGARVPKNLQTGVDWLKKGAALKDVKCYSALGKFLTDGTVRDRELIQLGLTNLGLAVKERHPGSCLRLGELYAKGRYVKTDKALAKKYLLLPAEQGDVNAQFLLGEVSDDLEEPKQAVKWYEKAARQKHVEAAFRLAEHVEQGKGATVNLHTAMAWYTRVDTAESHYRQGLIMATGGAGVNADLKRATAAFKKAADKNHREACYRLGIHARDGVGMSVDKDEAVRLLTKAADEGHADASLALGMCYHDGYGNLKKNKKVATYYIEAAAAGGNEKAKSMLKGGPQSPAPKAKDRKSGGLKRLLNSTK